MANWPSTADPLVTPTSTTPTNSTTARHSNQHGLLSAVALGVAAKLGYSSSTSGAGIVSPSTSVGDILRVSDTLGRTSWGPKAAVCLADTVLASTSALVTVSGIPGTYRDLMIQANVRTDSTASAAITGLAIQFNGDTSTAYSYQLVIGTNASVSAAQGIGQSVGMSLGGTLQGNAPAGRFAMNDIVIPNYGSTFQKNARCFTGGIEGLGATSNSTGKTFSGAGTWASTAPITSVSFIPGAAAFAVGSRFTVQALPTT